MGWFCYVDAQVLGPLTAAQLKQWVAAGRIVEDTPVRKEGDADWRPAASVKGLIGDRPTAPAPSRPASALSVATPAGGGLLVAEVVAVADASVPGAALVRSRPISLTVLAWLCILEGVMGVVSPAMAVLPHFQKAAELIRVPVWLFAALGFTAGVTSLIFAAGLLRGRNWGRVLCLGVTAVRTFLLLAQGSVLGAFAGATGLGIAAFVLYRRPARVFFGQDGGRTDSNRSADDGPFGTVLAYGLTGLNAALVVFALGYIHGLLPDPYEKPDADRLASASGGGVAVADPDRDSRAPHPADDADRDGPMAPPQGREIPVPAPPEPPAPVEENPANETRTLGGGGGPLFREAAPPGGRLIGFEVGLGKFFENDVIRAVRPIFRVGDIESFGGEHGRQWDRVVETKAKPGYAVGGITVKAGLTADGFSVRYMRVAGDRLDPADAYESPWIGGPGGGGPQLLAGDGRTVRGMIGREEGEDCTGLGLMFDNIGISASPPRPGGRFALRPSPQEPLPPPSSPQILPHAPVPADPANETATLGGGGAPLFREAAPPGGRLIGFEVGLGKFFENDVIRAVRPIFRVGDTESFGGEHGRQWDRVLETKAKPGYAVGGITVKAGLGVDGFSVKYMRIAGDRLDPADTYESPWFGGQGGDEPQLLAGDGRSIRGLIGREDGEYCIGLGLLFDNAGIPPSPSRPGGIRFALRPSPQERLREIDPAHRADAETALEGGDQTRIIGGWGGSDPHYRDVAPAGGLLVGLELGIGAFFDVDVVYMVRPIYRVGGKEQLGKQYGKEFARKVRLVARPGYAVSALRVKSGANADGFRLTFSRVLEGKLDVYDSYESAVAGHADEGGLVQFTGRGRPVVGIVGTTNERHNSGIGLVFDMGKPNGAVP